MSFTETLTALIPSDPATLLQVGVLLCASVLLFFLLYTLKDILLRTDSFAYQFASVLLVGFLPIVGFLLYVLIRPARTIKEREIERMLKEFLGEPGEDVEFDLSELIDLDDDEETDELNDDEAMDDEITDGEDSEEAFTTTSHSFTSSL